jgi:hypothetical protein
MSRASEAAFWASAPSSVQFGESIRSQPNRPLPDLQIPGGSATMEDGSSPVARRSIESLAADLAC